MSVIKRSKSRELNLQMMFWKSFTNIQIDNYKEFIVNFKEEFIENDFEIDMDHLDQEYSIEILEGISNNIEKIDSLIENNLKNWKISRLPKIDLSILRLAVFEMCFLNLHYNIIINEALELSKKYSPEKSKSYINGVLNSLKEVKIEN